MDEALRMTSGIAQVWNLAVSQAEFETGGRGDLCVGTNRRLGSWLRARFCRTFAFPAEDICKCTALAWTVKEGGGRESARAHTGQ